MTTEEAIKHFEAHAKCNYAPTREAARLAISALHAQQTPLDRSRWEGCPLCEKADKISGSAIAGWGKLHITANAQFRFCPMCGRPLTEEAWAELERRIGGNDETD